MSGGWTEDDWDDEEAEASAEWLTMLRAVDLLATARSLTNPSAKESVLELLADGQLKLRCQRSLQEPDVGPINWQYRSKVRVADSQGSIAARREMPPPSVKRFRPRTLARTYWLQRDGWLIDRSRVDWVSSTIVATKPLKIGDKSDGDAQTRRLRRAANGVEILRDLALFPLSAAELASRTVQPLTNMIAGSDQLEKIELEDINTPLKTIKKRGGGREPSEDWNDWIAELTIFVHDTGFDPRIGNEKNYSLIRDRLHERGLESPPYSKVQKALGAIRRRWIDYFDKKSDQPAKTAPTAPKSEPSPDR